MNILSNKVFLANHNSLLTRGVFTALLLASLALAIFAGNPQTAQASGLEAATNLALNGSFEKDSDGDGIPNQWGNAGLSLADKRVCNQSYSGACSFKMVGDAGDSQLRQDIAVSGLAGDEFSVRVWTKGKDLSTGEAYVFVEFMLTGGGSDQYAVTVPAGSSPWTLRTLHPTVSGNYDSIVVILQMSPDSGKAWFDQLKIVEIP